MFFILRDYLSIQEISEKAYARFGQLFSEKLFRAQLSYFADIDYTEAVEFTGPAATESEVKSFLIDKATDIEI